MSKLFRGGALSDTALLAREAIQNSNDAHERFKKTHPDIPFRVTFRFVHLFGEEKAAAVRALDLQRMQERRKQYPSDPLQPDNALDKIDDPRVPLKLLFVEDWGTHGLYGDPANGKNSHLFMAMYYIGASTKAADEGGLYGFGKSALQRASRTRTVIVHTAFEQQDPETDPARTRLLGFTWWPDLQEGNQLFNGRGSFSNNGAATGQQPFAPLPYEDSEADHIAAALGFQERNAENPAELGSSFLIIDPAVSPDQLLAEIERWWWPALEEHNLDVEVIMPGTGESHVPKPAQNPLVAQFLPAYRIATGVDEPGDPNKERLASKDWRNTTGAGKGGMGSLALTVYDGPSEEEDDSAESETLVALMRSPRMVVEYSAFTRRRVPLRGVFVASDKANKLLRETEPSTHDRWNTNPSADVPREATDLAQAVQSRIKRSVAKMSKDIAPPPPKANKSLTHFSKLMKGFFGNKPGKASPAEPGGERIELTFPDGRPAPEILNESEVFVESKFAVRVANDAPNAGCPVKVECHLYILEDETHSQSRWPVELVPVTPGHGLVPEEDGSWSGLLSKDKRILFKAKSDSYPNLWTVTLQPTVSRTGDWIG
ncbi:hypothetical protein [Dietzia kunjamensis]|uniref:hypothetical protein n=1 Tax=Dietzia kunjamensis TaxID=322509 RepID=UPI002096A512|nr:hypothetical protein [Dietzia kunjamensis]USX46298.1 hypothetical protein NHB83_01980 [Dietzia kunjamensis]